MKINKANLKRLILPAFTALISLAATIIYRWWIPNCMGWYRSDDRCCFQILSRSACSTVSCGRGCLPNGLDCTTTKILTAITCGASGSALCVEGAGVFIQFRKRPSVDKTYVLGVYILNTISTILASMTLGTACKPKSISDTGPYITLVLPTVFAGLQELLFVFLSSSKICDIWKQRPTSSSRIVELEDSSHTVGSTSASTAVISMPESSAQITTRDNPLYGGMQP